MNYDKWKLATPPMGNKIPMSEKCECGKKKNLCDSFCEKCKAKRKSLFNPKKITSFALK